MLKHFILISSIILININFCYGESTVENNKQLILSSENPPLLNNSEKIENLSKSGITCSDIKITKPITQKTTTTPMPKWRIKLEEAKAEAKKRSEERKARVKRFQEEYCRWMKLPLPERRIAIKKWYAERRKECQNFWCPNFAKKGNESEALYWERQERAKIRREEALAKIEEIKNRNKLKAQARTKIPTIGSTIIGHSTFSPTNKLFNSSIMPETVISNEKSEIKENETKIEENKIKLNNESFNIEPTTPETIKSTIIIIPTTIFSEQLINKEKTEEIQTSTNPTNNIYNSTVINNEQLIMEKTKIEEGQKKEELITAEKKEELEDKNKNENGEKLENLKKGEN